MLSGLSFSSHDTRLVTHVHCKARAEAQFISAPGSSLEPQGRRAWDYFLDQMPHPFNLRPGLCQGIISLAFEGEKSSQCKKTSPRQLPGSQASSLPCGLC